MTGSFWKDNFYSTYFHQALCPRFERYFELLNDKLAFPSFAKIKLGLSQDCKGFFHWPMIDLAEKLQPTNQRHGSNFILHPYPEYISILDFKGLDTALLLSSISTDTPKFSTIRNWKKICKGVLFLSDMLKKSDKINCWQDG